jgi:hypothetical protein
VTGPRILRVVCLLASLGWLIWPAAGCGYALTGRGSFLPEYIRTIGIPLFANRTKVPDVEIQITERVRGEFLGRGRYEIHPEGNNTDAVLIGEVLSVTVDPSAFTTDQIASRYIITMTARVELRDTRANMVLWEDPRLTFRQEYDAQSGTGVLDPSAFFSQDVNALERISNEFARTIVSAILEAF